MQNCVLISESSQTSQFERNNRRVTWVFGLTLFTMIAEVVVGSWAGSMALLADGWHMGTHAAAFAITMFTYYYAKKHAHNPAFAFGTWKVQYLGGFASAIALGVVALLMAVESIQRFYNPEQLHFGEALIVAFIGLAVNVASIFLLHEHHDHGHNHSHSHEEHEHKEHSHHEHNHSHHHEHHHDHNIKAAYFHVMADALTSVLAIFALCVGHYLGWMWVDASMGIVGAIIISKWAYSLIKESSLVLLDKNTQAVDVTELKEHFTNEGQVDVLDLHVWKVTQTQYAAIVKVKTKAKAKVDVDYIKAQLKNYAPITHFTVELI